MIEARPSSVRFLNRRTAVSGKGLPPKYRPFCPERRRWFDGEHPLGLSRKWRAVMLPNELLCSHELIMAAFFIAKSEEERT